MYSLTLKFFFILAYSTIATSFQCLAKEVPKIQLATVYKSSMKKPLTIEEYFVSEKLDGIRGYWNGKNLYTRAGNLIHAPAWFTQGWPSSYLDGELWSKRSEFEKISSCVRTRNSQKIREKSCWQNIRLMIFDLPKHSGNFAQRVEKMNKLVVTTKSLYLQVIHQEKLDSVALLHQRLSKVVNLGGEGLMLHHQEAYYRVGRSNALMKLKQHDDAEAKVIAHIMGKGKYRNKLGSIVVELPSGLTFKIGSGFTDQQRTTPPKIGSVITFKYIGKTARGVPRFASFLRIREHAIIQ